VITSWEHKWERTSLLRAQHCSGPLAPAPPELGKRRIAQVVVPVMSQAGTVQHQASSGGPHRQGDI